MFFSSHEFKWCKNVGAVPITHHYQRGLTVSLQKLLWLVVAMVIYGNVVAVWAYDTGPATNVTDPCIKVNFSNFTPPPFSRETNNTEVPPKSYFSFLVTGEVKANSVKVSIKGEAVPVTLKPQQNGTLVSGNLPDSIKGKYIRVEISAKGPAQCDKLGGWLLKVGN